MKPGRDPSLNSSANANPALGLSKPYGGIGVANANSLLLAPAAGPKSAALQLASSRAS